MEQCTAYHLHVVVHMRVTSRGGVPKTASREGHGGGERLVATNTGAEAVSTGDAKRAGAAGPMGTAAPPPWLGGVGGGCVGGWMDGGRASRRNRQVLQKEQGARACAQGSLNCGSKMRSTHRHRGAGGTTRRVVKMGGRGWLYRGAL